MSGSVDCEGLRHADFPALCLAADSASIEAQNSLIFYHRCNNILLIAGAGAAAWSTSSRVAAIASAVLFLGSLFLYLYGRHNDLQAKWYQARALAESVKTATWRFVMCAEPFHDAREEGSLDTFRRLLDELLAENRGIGEYLSGDWADKDQITPQMLAVRGSDFDRKRQMYLACRIDDQRSWYARKATDNRLASRKWFRILCALYGVAIVCLLVRVSAPDTPYLPIDVLAVAAGCAIGWIQLKRFDELASAYALTAQEIGIVKSRFLSVSDSGALARFVGDAENAFSREHTQWAARRDHAP